MRRGPTERMKKRREELSKPLEEQPEPTKDEMDCWRTADRFAALLHGITTPLRTSIQLTTGARYLNILAGHDLCQGPDNCPLESQNVRDAGEQITRLLNARDLTAAEVMVIFGSILYGISEQIREEEIARGDDNPSRTSVEVKAELLDVMSGDSLPFFRTKREVN